MLVLFDVTTLGRKATGIEQYLDSVLTHLPRVSSIRVVVAASRGQEWCSGWEYPVVFGPRWREVAQQTWLPKFARRVAPDLVVDAGLGAALGLSCERVVLLHDDFVWSEPELVGKRARLYARPTWERVLPRSRGVITPSPWLGRSRHVQAAGGEVLGSTGISFDLPPIEDGPVGGTADPYWLFVGTREPRKNLNRLLAAFDYFVRAGGLPRRLVVAGRQGWGGRTTRDVPGVTFAGYVSRHDLWSLYKSCFALIAPSLNEGYGCPVVEAASVGARVVAPLATVPAAQELKSNGYAGVADIRDPMDVSCILEAMRSATRLPARSPRYHMGSEQVAAKFAALLEEAARRA